MATLTVAGIPPLDGDYELNIGAFTNRELHTIKEISGVRAGELKAALEASDNDLIVAFAVIVIRRAGKQVHPDQIWDADTGAITVTPDAVEVEERPPTSASSNGSTSENDDAEDSNVTRLVSGQGSSHGGDEQASHPSRIGGPGSDISAHSDLAISAS